MPRKKSNKGRKQNREKEINWKNKIENQEDQIEEKRGERIEEKRRK